LKKTENILCWHARRTNWRQSWSF